MNRSRKWSVFLSSTSKTNCRRKNVQNTESPERTIRLIKSMIKNRDNVVAEGIQVLHLALEKEYKRMLGRLRSDGVVGSTVARHPV